MAFVGGSVRDLFKVEAMNLKDLDKDQSIGFKIPDYQREYQWNKEKIERLYCDVLNGLFRLTESKRETPQTGAYTFLGAIILVNQDRKSDEPTFDGTSLEVIDGQQRLTTLILIACAIFDVLNVKYPGIKTSNLKKYTKEWLEKEIKHWQACMYSCSLGELRKNRLEKSPFPRIVRDGDFRAKETPDTDYKSAIAIFLCEFHEHWKSETSDRFETRKLDNEQPSKNLKRNYAIISNLVQGINNSTWYEDNDADMMDLNWLPKKQTKQLFANLPTDETETNKVLDDVMSTNEELVEDVIRTMLFGSYLINYITLSRVVVSDESSAFDIFDALNTTGEPLTALETLKPVVLNRKNSEGDSEVFTEAEKHLEKKLNDKEHKRQEETKELVITFALYWSGRKLSKDLASQRSYLRQELLNSRRVQDQLKEHTNAFLDSLRIVSKFRRYYWNSESIDEINQFHTSKVVDEIKLLMSFIIDMKSSLTLPILASYWSEQKSAVFPQEKFLSVLRAIVAFIVLRRGYTGYTEGIDSELRRVMEVSHFALCRARAQTDEPKSVEELKNHLISLLEKKFNKKLDDREHWVSITSKIPLYKRSRPLVRFMIFAANDNAEPSINEAGMLQPSTKIPIVGQKGFLNIELWNDEGYRTIEHVAPSNENSADWDESIYSGENSAKDVIGNLVLLPSLENSVVSNANWQKKKLLYNALANSDKSAVEGWIGKAKQQNINLPKKVEDNLKKQYGLSLLNSITEVQIWNHAFVIARSRNLCELCWDRIRPWLD